MQTYTLILVEDDADVRERLAQLIVQHDSFELLAAAGDVAEGLAALAKHRPDILLTDLGLPDGSGIEIIKAIDEQNLDCEAMVISGFQDEHRVFSALEAGAKAYILKHDKSQKITDAILNMMNGGAPISPVIARLMLRRFQAPLQNEHDLPEALTPRQIDILKLVSQGFSSREIAEKLGIRYYTVTTHIKNIYNKLQVNSRTEALYEAGRLGLLP
ncbi:MAG TPA: response regulator transcription factor [Gammaproteobacteria bacterium]|nr:response regulator transcription factor [Gammaproteobacteria bacterium]